MFSFQLENSQSFYILYPGYIEMITKPDRIAFSTQRLASSIGVSWYRNTDSYILEAWRYLQGLLPDIRATKNFCRATKISD